MEEVEDMAMNKESAQAEVGSVCADEQRGLSRSQTDLLPGDSAGGLTLQKGSDGDNMAKPSLSYIAMIAKVILSSPAQKLNLASIYADIEERFPYFRSRGQGWKNSVRHNLSLNDCFVKMGRCEDGKGSYWGIHPAHLSDFLQGDFRQHRKASRSRHRRGLQGGAPAALHWVAACPQCPLPAPCFSRTLSHPGPAVWSLTPPGRPAAGMFCYERPPWRLQGWGVPDAVLGRAEEACCSLCVRAPAPPAPCGWQWTPAALKDSVYPWTRFTDRTYSV